MGGAEHDRGEQSSGPEAHAPGKREKPVAAKGQFFADGYSEKNGGPANRVAENCASRERHGINLEVTHRTETQQESGKCSEAPNATFPKSLPECLAGRNAVIVQGALLHAGYDPGCQDDKKRNDGLRR